ncbi:uncharacterized protein LOC106169039 [Lingula anatina]|nr:uncharacterized protein LOC106169039 [Lingula anatina]|eukprot:XP_013403782.2 uncharacterized protein LOC106169039 [Lingula anatina]
MQNSVEMRGITVNITREGNSSKQVVLALSSFEAVQWTVDVPAGVNVSEILLFSPNIYSTVVPARHGSADSPKLPLVAIFRQPYGYGIDSEGYGSTPALLESVEEETQTKITSFTGSSVVDRFELTVGLM